MMRQRQKWRIFQSKLIFLYKFQGGEIYVRWRIFYIRMMKLSLVIHLRKTKELRIRSLNHFFDFYIQTIICEVDKQWETTFSFAFCATKINYLNKYFKNIFVYFFISVFLLCFQKKIGELQFQLTSLYINCRHFEFNQVRIWKQKL